ncbi:MAG: hypothetical protein SF053_05470 [Bacteroidia bacterium]|nr:hypothetical protein [Bacteroidia bacterium]
MMLRFGLILMVFLAAACKTAAERQPASGATQAAPTPGAVAAPAPAPDQPDPRVREMAQEEWQSAQAYPASDSADFPFVYRPNDSTRWFRAWTMNFRLTHRPPLVAKLNTETPWINPDVYNENNGTFVTYVRDGAVMNLSNPYIHVQYIHKRLPYCGTTDSVLLWLDQNFSKDPALEILQDKYELPTASGLRALCKDYKTGGVDTRPAKYLSYAYISYDESYIVGLALTTQDVYAFNMYKPMFQRLVSSFVRL